ncbi:MAG: phosphatase PAP2 family protein [Saccharofermentans sp.]|nr:phosphatase PAP2 family protein [Saccharofermentans sp.]
MKRIIIEQSQKTIHQIENEADKQIGRFCELELRNLKNLHDWLYSPEMDRFMINITSLGNLGTVWILIALLLMISEPDKQHVGASMLIALVMCIVIGNILIKNIVRRNRPFFHKNYKMLIKQPWDYSFPSGHTLSSFAAATVLFSLNQTVGILSLVLAVMIALSRLYLRVHFFTDVFFSMILGTGIGILAVKAYETHFFGLI